MAFHHFALTLQGTGIPLRVSRVLAGAPDNGQPPSSVDLPCRQIIFSADPAAAAVIYVGGTNATLTTTNAAFTLDPTAATAVDKVVLGGFDQGPLRLSDFFAIGAANERLFIGIVPY